AQRSHLRERTGFHYDGSGERQRRLCLERVHATGGWNLYLGGHVQRGRQQPCVERHLRRWERDDRGAGHGSYHGWFHAAVAHRPARHHGHRDAAAAAKLSLRAAVRTPLPGSALPGKPDRAILEAWLARSIGNIRLTLSPPASHKAAQ